MLIEMIETAVSALVIQQSREMTETNDCNADDMAEENNAVENTLQKRGTQVYNNYSKTFILQIDDFAIEKL